MNNKLNKAMNPMEIPKNSNNNAIIPEGKLEDNFDSLSSDFIFRSIDNDRAKIQRRIRDGYIMATNEEQKLCTDPDLVLMKITPKNRNEIIKKQFKLQDRRKNKLYPKNNNRAIREGVYIER